MALIDSTCIIFNVIILFSMAKIGKIIGKKV